VTGLAELAGRLAAAMATGSRRLPSPALVILAAIGASLLVIIGVTEWRHFNDEHAYWQAGVRLVEGRFLYDPTAAPNTPFAYWYPPPLAQVLAPLTGLVSAEAFSVAWTVLLLACLWWLAGRNPLVALALIAFLPVAVELRVRNVHLLLGVLLVLALRRSWAFWVVGAAIKVTPVLGVAYLAAAGRWREAAKVIALGTVVLAVSVALTPGAWQQFLDIISVRGGTDGGSLVAIPFPVRFAAGGLLVVAAGWLTTRRSERAGEALLVVGLTVANPTLWMTAFSLLVAILPLWRSAERAPARAMVGQVPADQTVGDETAPAIAG
jgi:hypothetical protein